MVNQVVKRSRLVLSLAIALAVALRVFADNVPPVLHSKVGTTVKSKDGAVALTISEQKQNFGGCSAQHCDTDVNSPKSAHFHPDGTKYYINSLEGCVTIVYDARTNQKIKVIKHSFNRSNAYLFAEPSALFHFKHYSQSKRDLNTFEGRPVESAFSHGGRYLWIPYYRRSYDINAQDPSAMAIVDTENDEIIKVMGTGPLPKMVATSHNGKYLAVAHWGDNTVSLLDISSNNPDRWHYVNLYVVDHQLKLDYSMTHHVNRDAGSGYMLRGTVFTPDDRYLLVACMGGGGGIAVIDVLRNVYLGRLTGIYNARHLLVKNGYLYASLNVEGIVQRIPLAKVVATIQGMKGKTKELSGWQRCKVGAGTRTISISPSGNYLFAACNSASRVYVVDTRTMTQVTSIVVDSYPVGLDLSSDGTRLLVTSQGRKGFGGNAVNLITVDYAEPEPDVNAVSPPAQSDSVACQSSATEPAPEESSPFWTFLLFGAGGILLFGILYALFRKK